MTPLTAIFSLMIVAGTVLLVYGIRRGGKAEPLQPEDLFLDFAEDQSGEAELFGLGEDDTMLRRREKVPFQSDSHQPEALNVTAEKEK